MKKVYAIVKSRGLWAFLSATFFDAWGSVLLSFGVQYTTKSIYGRPMRLDLGDKGIGRTLWLYGERELDHKWMLEQTLKVGVRVLDIGANIGYYAIMERALVGETGQVVAVEPSPTNVKLLRKNIELNKFHDIKIHEGAVSEVSGRKEFWLAAESNLNSFHKDHLDQSGTIQESIEVDVFSVASLIEKYGSINYIRMDIEGHEFEVLRAISELNGSQTLLPDVIFETHNRTYSPDRDISRLLRTLFEKGYSVPYASSSSPDGTRKLEQLGSPGTFSIRTDDTRRTIHEDLSIETLEKCLNPSGGIRTIFLRWRRAEYA